MKEGDIIKIPLPQQDKKIKSRPALLIKQVPNQNDWLVAGISSKKHKEIKNFDFFIDENHSDFKATGLIFPGLIRLGFLATISQSDIEGVIGKISVKTHKKIINTLKKFLEGKLNEK